MEILKLGAQLIDSKLGDSKDIGRENIEGALKELFSNDQGEINFLEIVGKFQSSELSALLPSWIGDGENAPLSVEQVSEFFSSDALQAFATKLGIDLQEVLSVLKDSIPEMIDQGSSADSLGEIFHGMLGGSSEGGIDAMKLVEGFGFKMS